MCDHRATSCPAANLKGNGPGSKPGAEKGALTFMIGGDKAVFEKVKPFFEPMGKNLYFCGGPSMGMNAKLTQNLVLSYMLQAFNEGMVLATKAGMDRSSVDAGGLGEFRR